MASYATSTQRKWWMFSEEALLEMRRERLREFCAQGRGGECITDEDFEMYRLFLEQKTIQLCDLLQYPRETVSATAVVFLKRYFLYSKDLDLGFTMVLTCIFLACKVEENYVRLRELLDNVENLGIQRLEESSILESEVTLLSALRFHLQVYHPFRSLSGFLGEMKVMVPELREAMPEISKVAVAYITSSLTTDLCFLAHAGSIALAALRLAASQVLTHLQPIDTYLKMKLSEGEMQKLMEYDPLFRLIEDRLTAPQTIVSAERIQTIQSAMESIRYQEMEE